MKDRIRVAGGTGRLSLSAAALCVLVLVSMGTGARAADAIRDIETPAAADVLTKLSTHRKSRHKLLMPSIGGNPGVVSDKNGRNDHVTFKLVWPGKRAKVIWFGEDRRADLKCARDASGFILAEYDKAGRGRKITKIRTFDATGKEVSSYVPEKGGLLAAVSGGKGLFIKSTYDKEKGRLSTVLLRDQAGKVVGRAGPFGIREIKWSDDGTRLIVNIGRMMGGGHIGPRGASEGVLVVDTKTGKTLHKLPATHRGQMSRRGDIVATTTDKQLTLWADGKKVKTFAPPSHVVFSPDSAYIGVRAGKEVRVYRVKDWALTMTVKAPSGHKFDILDAAISNSGRLFIRTFMPARDVAQRYGLLFFYSSDGSLLWSRRSPWKDGRGTVLGKSFLLPDGTGAQMRMRDRAFRVTFPVK